MKTLFKYFLKVRPVLLYLLAGAVLAYISIEFIFTNYTELFKGANKLGQLVSKLSVSYMSAFLFYFIVVHIKSEKDKENINEYVGLKVYSIITSAHLFIEPFLQIENKKASLTDYDMKKLRPLLASIEREARDAPFSFEGETENGTWLDWWEYLRESTFKSLKEIFVRYNHIDTKLIKILTRIENSIFFYQWQMLYHIQYDKSFGMFHPQIEMYLVHINELQEYADKNLSEYRNRTSEFMGYKPKVYGQTPNSSSNQPQKG